MYLVCAISVKVNVPQHWRLWRCKLTEMHAWMIYNAIFISIVSLKSCKRAEISNFVREKHVVQILVYFKL